MCRVAYAVLCQTGTFSSVMICCGAVAGADTAYRQTDTLHTLGRVENELTLMGMQLSVVVCVMYVFVVYVCLFCLLSSHLLAVHLLHVCFLLPVAVN